MTEQVSGVVFVDERPWSLAAACDGGPFDPALHAMRPSSRTPTSCHRGWVPTYAVADGRLILRELAISVAGLDDVDLTTDAAPALNGVRPVPGTMLRHAYRDLGLRLRYTGGLLIGRNHAAWNNPFMFVERGPWDFRQVREIVCVDGVVREVFDRSVPFRTFRRRVERQQPGARGNGEAAWTTADISAAVNAVCECRYAW